jgi:uncharacterized protein (DUF2252 family)
MTRADQVALGVAERARVPRRTHGPWEPPAGRFDPVAMFEAEMASRVPELIPVRHARMMTSPFAFYRGAAAVMANDLAPTPRTRLEVQLSGDAHLANFGVFASPDRTLVFDLNDFDETLPGPFEWDVKRLATSFIVAGRTVGWKSAFAERAARTCVAEYRTRMRGFAKDGVLETWHSRIALDDAARLLATDRRRTVGNIRLQAAKHDDAGALHKLTAVVDGRRRFIEDPPVMVRASDDVMLLVRELFRAYRRTLSPERRALLDRYRLVDLARRAVGVSSVGTRCWIIHLEGADDGDPLFLQAKEAEASALEGPLPASRHRLHAQRVVYGQRLLQASSDVFLGWLTDPFGHQYYWRQLWDSKVSIDIGVQSDTRVLAYARACGWALARGHARSGSAIAIATYLGETDRFDRAMAEFGMAYADQNERDHAAFADAVRSGRLEATGA